MNLSRTKLWGGVFLTVLLIAGTVAYFTAGDSGLFKGQLAPEQPRTTEEALRISNLECGTFNETQCRTNSDACAWTNPFSLGFSCTHICRTYDETQCGANPDVCHWDPAIAFGTGACFPGNTFQHTFRLACRTNTDRTSCESAESQLCGWNTLFNRCDLSTDTGVAPREGTPQQPPAQTPPAQAGTTNSCTGLDQNACRGQNTCEWGLGSCVEVDPACRTITLENSCTANTNCKWVSSIPSYCTGVNVPVFGLGSAPAVPQPDLTRNPNDRCTTIGDFSQCNSDTQCQWEPNTGSPNFGCNSRSPLCTGISITPAAIPRDARSPNFGIAVTPAEFAGRIQWTHTVNGNEVARDVVNGTNPFSARIGDINENSQLTFEAQPAVAGNTCTVTINTAPETPATRAIFLDIFRPENNTQLAAGEGTTFRFAVRHSLGFTPLTANVVIRISSGTTVIREIQAERLSRLFRPVDDIVWDGRDANNNIVPAGTYTYALTASAVNVENVTPATATGTFTVTGTAQAGDAAIVGIAGDTAGGSDDPAAEIERRIAQDDAARRGEEVPRAPVLTDLGPDPASFGPGEGTRFRFSLNQTASVQVNITEPGTPQPRLIREIRETRTTTEVRELNIAWDGRDTNGALVPVGSYTYEIRASNPNGTATPQNGTFEIRTVQTGTQADLTMRTVNTPPLEGLVGQELSFTALQANIGSAAAESISRLTIYQADRTTEVARVDDGNGTLPPNVPDTARFAWTPTTAGRYEYRICIDPDNTVAESSETNNCSDFFMLTIGGGTPPPPPSATACTSLAVTPTEIPIGATELPLRVVAQPTTFNGQISVVHNRNNEDVVTDTQNDRDFTLTVSSLNETSRVTVTATPSTGTACTVVLNRATEGAQVAGAGAGARASQSTTTLRITPAEDNPSGPNNIIPINDHDLYVGGIYTFSASAPLRITQIKISPTGVNATNALDVSKIKSLQLYRRDNIRSNDEPQLTTEIAPSSDGSVTFTTNWIFTAESLTQDLLIGFSLNQDANDAGRRFSFGINAESDIILSEGRIAETPFPISGALFAVEGTPTQQVAGTSGGTTNNTTRNSTSGTSCESRGLYTYTGPDSPGQRFTGMCIPCRESKYIELGGTCDETLSAARIVMENKTTNTSPTDTASSTTSQRGSAQSTGQSSSSVQNGSAQSGTSQNVAAQQQAVATANELIRTANSALALQQNLTTNAFRPAADTNTNAAVGFQQPNLNQSQRLTYVPDRSQTGPGIGIYFGVLGAQAAYLAWRKRKRS
ncbi:hypothetical protein COV82_06285 [Candidatus Peregrinibacteria bacterium CG11_big_fil_rev_8_21_14_0_20_46_8]|nr:MAG: hypothetical protein COV82_06285 [Candidatus Peregrinibacteria bacterium CG11_big_fil_rev_8_21_14_0_20_46_8]